MEPGTHGWRLPNWASVARLISAGPHSPFLRLKPPPSIGLDDSQRAQTCQLHQRYPTSQEHGVESMQSSMVTHRAKRNPGQRLCRRGTSLSLIIPFATCQSLAYPARGSWNAHGGPTRQWLQPQKSASAPPQRGSAIERAAYVRRLLPVALVPVLLTRSGHRPRQQRQPTTVTQLVRLARVRLISPVPRIPSRTHIVLPSTSSLRRPRQ